LNIFLITKKKSITFISKTLQQHFSQRAILLVTQLVFWGENNKLEKVASLLVRYQTGQFVVMDHAKVHKAQL